MRYTTRENLLETFTALHVILLRPQPILTISPHHQEENPKPPFVEA